MFLHVLADHVKNRTIQLRFKWSGETISRHFGEVLKVVIRLQGSLLKKSELVPTNSTDLRWKWFKNCLGALYGTYIQVQVLAEDRPRYRSRKGEIATNVLGVCSQDMQFIYVLLGWEGSTVDGRVLRDAITRRNGLKIPHALSTICTSSSIGPKRLGTNKRSWTFDEESKLIETLIELHNSGRFKAERDFKAEHFKDVEDILQVKLPGHGIKAKPHIESKLMILRNHFGIVHDMLAGNNCSGFSWDSVRKCVTAENAVWEEYLKHHQNAKPFRFKAFSFYEELCIVFGKDRATGKNVEAPAGILEELKNEAPTLNDVNENITADQSESSIFFKTNEESSKPKKNESENIASFSKVIKEYATIFGMEIEKATDRLSRALEDSDASDKRLMINNELTKLYGLTMFERHKATRKIGCNRETTDIFFTIPDDEKEIWVKALLNGDI